MLEIRIGGNKETGYEKFQVLREQAMQRMRRGEMETRLQEAIRKHSDLAKQPAPDKTDSGLPGKYFRAGGLGTASRSNPNLGQVLDITA